MINEKTNEQWNTVAKTLGLKGKEFLGGIERCEFSVGHLSAFVDCGFISPAYKFNGTPTVETFYEFGKRAEESGATVEYIGFLESKDRDNARLIIEGIEITKFPDSTSLILDFAQTFHDADEFTSNAELLRAWYD